MTPVPQSYSTEVEGGAPVALRYAISGRRDVARYVAFVANRAEWLDIDGWIEGREDGSVVMVAAGPEALVGALEMACTLGPIEALVEQIEAVDERGPVARGFEVRPQK